MGTIGPWGFGLKELLMFTKQKMATHGGGALSA